MKVLKNEEIGFLTSCDPIGTIFFYNNRVFRKINNAYKEKILSFLDSEVFKLLLEKRYFVNTWISDEYTFEDGALVLEHEKLVVTDPSTWTFSMLKECACFILELNQFLNKYKLTLLDGHGKNFAFVDGKPLLFDLGSIVELKHYFPFYKEFVSNFIYPLICYSNNEDELGKVLVASACRSVTVRNSVLLNQYYEDMLTHLPDNYAKMQAFLAKHLPDNKIFGGLKNKFENEIKKYKKKYISVSDIRNMHWNTNKTLWSNYYSNELDTYKNDPRFNSIINDLQEFCSSAESVVDVAGNQGIISLMIKERLPFIKRIINLDYDENAIEGSYIYIYENKVPGIVTLVNNFMYPELRTLFSVKSDIALALALTHHLFLSQNLKIDDVFKRLKDYSNKYVLVEFMPLGLWNGKTSPQLPEWYSYDWFKENFEKYFKILKIAQYGTNRILFIGEIIS